MSSGLPFWHTTPGAPSPRRKHFLGAAVFAWLVPVVLGLAVVWLLNLLGAPDKGLPSLIRVAGTMLVFAGSVTWIFLLLGIPLAALALRTGFAGWSVACLGGAIVATLAPAVVPGTEMLITSGELALFMLAFGAAHAALFWGALRWMSPASFAKHSAV